jgi:hypothetical protein
MTWPVFCDGAARAMTDFEEKYFFEGMKGYDENGQIVRPGRYEEVFRGSIARISFTLRRGMCCLDDTIADRFIAEICEICAVREPGYVSGVV